jgi:hypothetical protein
MNRKRVKGAVKLTVLNFEIPLRRIRWASIMELFCFLFGATAPSGPGPPHLRGFWITHNDAPQSVGLLWTSDQSVAETST